MIYKSSYIELYVNGKHVELESQKSLNLRFNNVLSDPTKISSTQAEYSFEFELPCTPNNNEIFDYANNLSKLNKFHTRWSAEVYADGSKIFDGTLTLSSVKDNKYNVNLVSVKVYSLDEIFGDAVMTDIRPLQRYANGTIKRDERGNALHQKWEIPFDGATSINAYNASGNPEVMFPLISYGVFQKDPYISDTVGNEYTSKFNLDSWNRWYYESFYPSHNMLETLRKAFETKDYIVGGDAFQDPNLKDVYMSINLADEQDPVYNLGNPKLGKVSIVANYNTSGNTPYQQELKFPYFRVSGVTSSGMQGITAAKEYNLSNIDNYFLLNGTVTQDHQSYMYQPNEKVIVIPASGFYKISMSLWSDLITTGNLTVGQYEYDFVDRELKFKDVQIPVGFNENTPIEVALVKNYEDNYELIKGKTNKRYVNGNPTMSTYTVNSRTYNNIEEWETCFPHEDLYNATNPTEKGDFNLTTSSQWGGNRANATNSGAGGTFGRTRAASTVTERDYSTNKLGYIYNDDQLMAYDQVVSSSFVCGFSSLHGGVMSVMKNGYSWSKLSSDEQKAFYPEEGYSFMTRNNGAIVKTQTEHNKNLYYDVPQYENWVLVNGNNQFKGGISAMVWLEKNDVLELMEAHRTYQTTAGTEVHYNTNTIVNLTIEAASPRDYYELKQSHFGYFSPSEYDINLNLANFFNKETKISDWVQNVIDAFNLDLVQNGNTVTINTKKKLTNSSVVEIDDRVNSEEAKSEAIDYPKSMAVKYKIDTDEWGAERSAVEANGGDESIMNDDNWKKYIDSGYTVIKLNDDNFVTSTSEKSLQFSYTWYDSFNWFENSGDTEPTATVRTPVISKFTYMIDGYDYDESMKHDGYGLSQRFWFKPKATIAVLPIANMDESVTAYTPSNYNNVINLSYKDTERSLLSDYFNIRAYLSSNYVEIDVYLSPVEYNRLKNGALVRFDSDLYEVVEISGYDPTGFNPTTLKIMKKTI